MCIGVVKVTPGKKNPIQNIQHLCNNCKRYNNIHITGIDEGAERMKQKKYSKQSRLRIFLNQCQTPHIVETQKYQARQTPKELYLGISYHVQTSKIKHLKKILEKKRKKFCNDVW